MLLSRGTLPLPLPPRLFGGPRAAPTLVPLPWESEKASSQDLAQVLLYGLLARSYQAGELDPDNVDGKSSSRFLGRRSRRPRQCCGREGRYSHRNVSGFSGGSLKLSRVMSFASGLLGLSWV